MPDAPRDKSIDIRQLTPADLHVMRGLNALFGRVFDDPAAYAANPPNDEYLAGLLGKPHIAVLVALENGMLTGGLVAYQLEKLEQRRSEFYIYDLAVDFPHRRRGIATALIARLKEIAADRGPWVIFVQADYGDDPAIALYEKLGVREDVMHFDIAPGPPVRE